MMKNIDLVTYESSIKEHSAYLFSLAYRLTGSHEGAQDLLQETLLRAWQKWKQLRNKENPIPWLRKMCIHIYIDTVRKPVTKMVAKETVFPNMEYEIISKVPTPEDEMLADEEVRLIHSQCFNIIMSTLPLYQRIVLVLNDIYQVGTQETSVLIDKSYSATKSLLHRAREKMTNNFRPYCTVVHNDTSCECKSWIVFAHNIEKRREYLNDILSSQIKTKADISETKERIIYLFNNLPIHPPPPLWIDNVIKKIK